MKDILVLKEYNIKNKRKKSIYKFSLSDYFHLFFGIWSLNQEMRIQLRVDSLQSTVGNANSVESLQLIVYSWKCEFS